MDSYYRFPLLIIVVVVSLSGLLLRGADQTKPNQFSNTPKNPSDSNVLVHNITYIVDNNMKPITSHHPHSSAVPWPRNLYTATAYLFTISFELNWTGRKNEDGDLKKGNRHQISHHFYYCKFNAVPCYLLFICAIPWSNPIHACMHPIPWKIISSSAGEDRVGSTEWG